MTLVLQVVPRFVEMARNRPGAVLSVEATTTIFDGLRGLMAMEGSVSFPLTLLISIRLVPTEKLPWARTALAVKTKAENRSIRRHFMNWSGLIGYLLIGERHIYQMGENRQGENEGFPP